MSKPTSVIPGEVVTRGLPLQVLPAPEAIDSELLAFREPALDLIAKPARSGSAPDEHAVVDVRAELEGWLPGADAMDSDEHVEQ